MTGYEAVAGEIDALAGRVDGLAGRLTGAADAGRTVAMNDSAYGVICQPFAALLQPFEEMGVQALSAAAEAVAGNAAKLRETSREYDRRESEQSADFDGMNA
ncbi:MULTISPECIES: type VII secretion target [Actinosynnema]|uniref:type VII secretion target n=1 Tax=Actinosynnema TaxID=40566 RepID=UPI0020A4EFAF|nr:type VII secretion target [Actinosynnema pretiosum]MCP2097134.1 Excreted virulence factor EspC, type VII ESX diderm [Actinosynnema pretiosum]